MISSNPSRDEGPMGTGRRLARSAAPEGSGEMASTPRREVLQGSRSIPTSTALGVRSYSQSIRLRAIASRSSTQRLTYLRWNVPSPLNRNGESRRSGRRKRPWVQSRVNLQLHQDVLHVRSHRIGRDRQLGSDLIGGGPDSKKNEHPLLLLGQPVGPWRVQCPPPWSCANGV